jgi:nanoRNase/pAp phosphatase (c-di-AMP/oligoRNAs hydrolase)
MISVGASIINRTSKVDVGALMLKHGGGGHKTVGTCQISPARADEVLKDSVKTINAKK